MAVMTEEEINEIWNSSKVSTEKINDLIKRVEILESK